MSKRVAKEYRKVAKQLECGETGLFFVCHILEKCGGFGSLGNIYLRKYKELFEEDAYKSLGDDVLDKSGFWGSVFEEKNEDIRIMSLLLAAEFYESEG